VPGCRNCGWPLRIIRDKGLFVCEHCGSQQEGPAIPEELEFLGERVIDAVRAYDAGTIRSSAPSRQKPGERTLNCPSCGQPFLSHHYGGPGNVVIDTCSTCLVNWLDQGELRRIALAPKSQRSSLDLDWD